MAEQRVRVLCLRGRSLLLVHDDEGWTLPAADLPSTELAETVAVRALAERCGIRPRVARRLPSPQAVRGIGAGWLVLALTDDDVPHEHAEGAAFHALTAERPIGPLDPSLWGGLAQVIASAAHQSAWIGARARSGAA